MRLRSLLMLALGATVMVGCSDDPETPPNTDACAGKATCATAGSNCNGDVLTVCQLDAAGCLVESSTDCAANGQSCDATGPAAMCVGEVDCSAKPNACDTAGTTCNGDNLVDCSADADGCLVETTSDCGASGQTCDDSGATAMCVDGPCQDDPECSAEGTSCDGDDLVECSEGADGCLDAAVTDCTDTSEVCDDTLDPPACATPCSDDCPVDGESFCQGTSLFTCEDSDADSCLDLTFKEDCAASANPVCDAGASMCIAQGSGASCADPFVVQADTQLSGADFYADFTDDQQLETGAGCISQPDNTPEVVFAVQLNPGDEVNLSEQAVIDIVLRFQETCGDGEACVDAVDGSGTGSTEANGISYENTTASPITVFASVEAYFASSGNSAYDIQLDITPSVCGDGIQKSNEACDDGNTVSGDGCAFDCSAVENGFECVEGLCYPTGNGDVCGTPIELSGEATFTMATTAFADDYSNYSGCGVAGGVGPDIVYSFEVLDNYVLEATSLSDDFGMAVVIATDCNDLSGSCADYGSGNGASAEFVNESGANVTVFIVADSDDDTTADDGNFTLEVAHRVLDCGDGFADGAEECDDGNNDDDDGCSAVCTLEYDTCADAQVVAQSGIFTGTSVPYTDDYGPLDVCPGNPFNANTGVGPDAVYLVTLPDGMILDALLDPQTGYDAALAFVDGATSNVCATIDGTTCLGVDDGAGPGGNEALSYTNTSGGDQDIYVIVDGYSGSAGAYELTLDIRAPTCGDGIVEGNEECDNGNTAPLDGCSAVCTIEATHMCFDTEPSACYADGQGDTCDELLLPTVGSGTYGGDTTSASYADDYDPAPGACPGTFGLTGIGPDKVYKIVLQDGESVTVTQDSLPPANADLGVYLVVDNDAVAICDTIDNTTCVAGDDGAGGGGIEQASYTNNSGGAETIYIINDGYNGAAGQFSLTIDIQ